MQIIKYEINKNILTVGFKEDDFVVYSDIAYNSNLTKQELLQKAYIQVKNTINYEKTQTEHSITTEETGEDFVPGIPKPMELDIDFSSLRGKVIDQYGNIYSEDVIFSIEGTDKAKIENGNITEQSVITDTEYYVVATYSNLIEKQKRVIYAPKLVEEQINNNLADVYEAIIGLDNRITKIEGGK